jgi:hypothetical protein
MTVRSAALVLAAFAAAWLTIFFSPVLLNFLGLGEFAIVGQAGFAILALSVLDRLYTRFFAAEDHPPPEH